MVTVGLVYFNGVTVRRLGCQGVLDPVPTIDEFHRGLIRDSQLEKKEGERELGILVRDDFTYWLKGGTTAMGEGSCVSVCQKKAARAY